MSDGVGELLGEGADAVAGVADDKPDRHLIRIRLDGNRFEGKRLPVDVTPELQRYERLVIQVAAQQWKTENPGRNLPRFFRNQFQLAIVDVEDGSATPVLERVSTSTYDDYFDQAAQSIDVAFESIVENKRAQDAWITELSDFRNFGNTLESGEAIEFKPKTREVIRYTPEIRSARFPETQVRQRAIKEDELRALVGKLTAIDANHGKFTLTDLHDREVPGFYTNSELTNDITAVLNASTLAPVARIVARVAAGADGRLVRITDVESVELFESEQEPWTRRLIELATLEIGWSEGTGEPIVFAALDAAREFLRSLGAIDNKYPGIFPSEDGGVFLEWASIQRIVSVEVSPMIEFSVFRLNPEDRSTEELETKDLQAAVEFLRGALS